LKAGVEFNYEVQNEYILNITATSSTSSPATLTKSVTISITNVNEAPSDITLSNNNIDEGLPTGSSIGVLAVLDEDLEESHSWNISGTDASNFIIVNNELRSNVVFDFSTKSSYSINITVTDNGSLSYLENFIVSINNPNAGTVVLSNASINENIASGTSIGVFTIEGVGNSEQYVYSLSGEDASSFSVGGNNGNELLSAESFNFESKSAYSITVSASEGSNSAIGNFAITINDAAESPFDITISSDVINENQPIGTQLATISVQDEDAGSTHTLALSGTGASGFSLSGTSIVTSTIFDFEQQTEYDITIVAVDNTSRTFSKDFTITIADVSPEPPKSITLSGNEIMEGLPSGSFIADIFVEDDDEGDTHTFALLGADASGFLISGSQLVSGKEFDLSAKSSHEITILATDGDGLSYSQDHTITILRALGFEEDNHLVSIYPNPASGHFQLFIDGSLGQSTWYLTDASGKRVEVKTTDVQNGVMSIDTSLLSAGMYFVQVTSHSATIIKRLLITKNNR
jgi:hypothetical protein